MSRPFSPEPRLPRLPGTIPPRPSEELTARIQEALRTRHLADAEEPIVGADAYGAFRDPLLWSAGPPVVVDANWLRNDLLYSCARQHQTVMLTAGNRGQVRLYCASHVLQEVDEHHAEWANHKGLVPSDVLDWWKRTYLPLLRLVEPPAGLLTPEEQARIDILQQRDPHDVPSATLALLLEAPLVSADKRPTQAVYGADAAVRRHSELLDLFRVTGDSVQFRETAAAAALIPYASGSALVQATIRAARAAPAVALISSAAVVLWLARGVRSETWRRIGRTAGRGLELVGEAFTVHQAWQERVQAAAPDPPSWQQLASRAPGEGVLTRALLRTFAHAPRSQLTVAELVGQLPTLPVASGERSTRRVLRAHTSAVFHEFPRGRWQLGGTPMAL